MTTTYLLPSLGRICLARGIDGSLELAQAHKSDGQLGKVGDAAEEDLRRVVHSVVEATVANLKVEQVRTEGDVETSSFQSKKLGE